jgi:hypothetical protein
MNIEDYKILRELAKQVRPYADNDEINDERTKANETFFLYASSLVPQIMDLFELYCEVNGNTVEDVFKDLIK